MKLCRSKHCSVKELFAILRKMHVEITNFTINVYMNTNDIA